MVELPHGGENLSGSLYIGFGTEAEHLSVPLSFKVARGKARAGEDCLKLIHPGIFPFQCPAAGGDSGGHIFRPFHPSFDLHRGDAHLFNQRQLFHQAHVF